jgi:hypothetical protein
MRSDGDLLKYAYRKIKKGDPRSRIRQFGEHFVSQIIEPLVHNRFAANNSELLHAAGLERDGDGLLILGPQNVGKTTAVLSLTRQGWSMLGDDFVVAQPSGQLTGYPKPLKIEREVLNRNKALKLTGGQSEHFNRLLTPARTLKLPHSSFERKMSAASLQIKVARQANLKAIIFLKRIASNLENPRVQVQKLSSMQVIDLLLLHQDAEFRGNKHLFRDIVNNLRLHFESREWNRDCENKSIAALKGLAGTAPGFTATINGTNSDLVSVIDKIWSSV